jgi:xylan 1,4-beta-xylosidase
VDEDYYIATSTFEWFPGIQIHHSKDLVNWELINHPLERLSQINMIGEDNSCGVWAPCLSYSNGIYYLIYTDVKSFEGMFKDTHNYLITAKDIKGPWSDPIYLNSSGFDPSLFHDRDGKKYILNMLMDYRSYQSKFGGIILQEYSEEKKCLVGEAKLIFKGTPIGFTEGPHIYWKDGYYYLVTAEGTTEFGHAVTVARSKTLEGPYEIAPNTPMLTTRHLPMHKLQKAGHGSFVETKEHKWYMAHLCSRPIGSHRRCILGRETALQSIIWKEGWPYLADGTNRPQLSVPIELQTQVNVSTSYDMYEDFDKDTWNIHLQSLRIPLEQRASLIERKGYIRLYGAESLNSKFYQSLLAHRQQSFYCEVVTKLDFKPRNFQQMAGLTYFYNTKCYYYLYITYEENIGRVISIIQCDLGKGTHTIGSGEPITEDGEIWMKLTTYGETAQYAYSLDGQNYMDIGEPIDASILSDDYFNKTGHIMFTGAFIGICCQDLSGQGIYADFDFFSYKHLDEE